MRTDDRSGVTGDCAGRGPLKPAFFPIKQLAEGGADAAHGDGRDDLDGIGLVLEFGDGEAFPRAAHKHKRDRGGAAQLQLRRKAQGRGAVPIAEQAIDDDEIRPERLLPQRGEDGSGPTLLRCGSGTGCRVPPACGA